MTTGSEPKQLIYRLPRGCLEGTRLRKPEILVGNASLVTPGTAQVHNRERWEYREALAGGDATVNLAWITESQTQPALSPVIRFP